MVLGLVTSAALLAGLGTALLILVDQVRLTRPAAPASHFEAREK